MRRKRCVNSAINPEAQAPMTAESRLTRYAMPPKGTTKENSLPRRHQRGYPGGCAMPSE
jgi:hypothetical protein